ncbi:hypothetical protein Ddc_15332 [Ditylenchus destructor]|nr:hypothetical protein Ddc_15332 [Ditylenchus destructor]
MLSRSKLDLFRMTNRTFADMIESGAKSLPLYPPSYLTISGPYCKDGERCINSNAEFPSFMKAIDNDSGMILKILEEYIYSSPKFKVMQEWDIENPDHHLFEGQDIPQTFLDDFYNELKVDDHYTAAMVMSNSGEKSIIALPKTLEVNKMAYTGKLDAKMEYYYLCNTLFIKHHPLQSARTTATIVLNGDEFHRTQDETFYYAVKSHCFTEIDLNGIPFTTQFLESLNKFVIKPLAMDAGRRNYRVNKISVFRCSFILESTTHSFLRLLSQPLPVYKMDISMLYAVSSSTFLDSVLNSPALLCASQVTFTMDCVFSSVTFSDDEVVLAFIFGDKLTGACRQYFASLDQPTETLRKDFLLVDWQPSENFFAKAIQKFFAMSPVLYHTVLPVTKSTVRLPGSRIAVNFLTRFLRNQFEFCLQEHKSIHDSSECDIYEFTEESSRKPARVDVGTCEFW